MNFLCLIVTMKNCTLFYNILKHFENKIEIVNGEVIDKYSGISPIIICEI